MLALQSILYCVAGMAWSACSSNTQGDTPNGTNTFASDDTGVTTESDPLPSETDDTHTGLSSDTGQTTDEPDTGSDTHSETASAHDTESTDAVTSTDEIYAWHVFFGSSNYDYMGDVAATSEGDVIVTGNSRAPWTGPAKEPPLHPFPASESGPCWSHYGDLFIAKVDAMGQYSWHTFWGPECFPNPRAANPASSVAVGTDDAIYVVGQTNATWAEPGPGKRVRPYSGGLDGYVLKLDVGGIPLWHGFFGGPGDDANAFVAVGPNEEIYVLGYGDGGWLGPGSEEPVFSHPGLSTAFLIKLESDGGYAWHAFLPDLAWQLVTDELGRLYLGGQSEHSWDGPGGETPLQPFAGSQDATVMALDEDGAFLWHTFVGTEGSDWYHGVVVGDDGGVVLIGRSDNTWDGPQKEKPISPHAGGQNLFALSLGTDGRYRWHTFAGYAEPGPSGAVFGTDRRENGELVFVGSSSSGWTGPLGETPQNPFAGGSDIMLLDLDARGGYLWHSFYGSSQVGGEGPVGDDATAAAVGANNALYAGGTSASPWDGPHGEPPEREGNYDDVVLLKVVHP